MVDENRYNAVPYHFNDELVKFISQHPEYVSKITPWIDRLTPEWSVQTWEISHFLQRIGGLSPIISTLIGRGDETSLAKAAYSLDAFGQADIKTCMEIIRRTDNENTISHIDGLLYSTEVVMGEYGIAESYESKAKTLSTYLNDPSDRVKKYAKRMVESFEASAKSERQRTEEGKQLRKLDFEG
ncbi:hypothetical protein KGP36_07660 [Patescibacteria group bacterium]|nr:hypothetical protein [Patescibacteria group bacterium]